jgi:4a-hydroxytetrahydrobiopterin dehydratase
MTDLLRARCQSRDVAAMSDHEVQDHLLQISSWQRVGDSIEKTFRFRNFHETVAFVNALAWICHVEDHHPELNVTYDRCVVRFSTHSVSGISRNDFICAAKADALVAFVG